MFATPPHGYTTTLHRSVPLFHVVCNAQAPSTNGRGSFFSQNHTCRCEMASQTLISLPKELLRQICGRLPSQAALDFILVCRCIYEACDDWTVWRDVIYRSQSYPRGVPVPGGGSNSGWKRYALADIKASGVFKPYELSYLRKWLPQLAAMCIPCESI